jgi:hypothetical protein
MQHHRGRQKAPGLHRRTVASMVWPTFEPSHTHGAGSDQLNSAISTILVEFEIGQCPVRSPESGKDLLRYQ